MNALALWALSVLPVLVLAIVLLWGGREVLGLVRARERFAALLFALVLVALTVFSLALSAGMVSGLLERP